MDFCFYPFALYFLFVLSGVFKKLFTRFWLCWAFIAPHRLWLQRAGATLPCSAHAYSSGFSWRGAEGLGVWPALADACGLSIFGSQALERRLDSCGPQA